MITQTEKDLLIAEQIYIMEAGILNSILEFENGIRHEFIYDFDNEKYSILKSKYNIERYAKGNSEFGKAQTLMGEFAPRLTHLSDYDNHIDVNALALLEYSLDNKQHGINCRSKAQIFNEMCLALGIYSRKLWIMPFSEYDSECHVVNEIWDTKLNKWIMLDITNNEYWVDENGTPLSVLEIRYKGAKQEFCTPVFVNEQINDLHLLHKKHFEDFVYIMKNMAFMEYCDSYSVGENKKLWLLKPKNKQISYNFVISENSITKSPIR